MKISRKYIYAALAGLAMFVIILDGKTAVQSAATGIELCIRTVIPSLFPFFILSGILSSVIAGQDIPPLRFLGRLCKIPRGSESILILGFLAGYPVGAQLIAQSYRDGRLSLQTARRMLCFCNNAGPAFIFGLVSTMFSSPAAPWLLWLIHILSGLLVGLLLPATELIPCRLKRHETTSLPKAMEKAIRTTATVCGWVVIFRIILGFCTRWFLWRLPVALQVLLSGLLELSNGCVRLSEVSSEGLRFVIAGILLSAGGLCVTMQTVSVSQSVFSGKYFLGKGLQIVFSALLALPIQYIVFIRSERNIISALYLFVLSFLIFLVVFLIFRKKDVAINKKLMYNAGSN